MDEIIKNLYLGSVRDAKKAIKEKSVDAIINVSRFENLILPRKCPINYFKIGFDYGWEDQYQEYKDFWTNYFYGKQSI